MKGRKRTPTPILRMRGSWRAKSRTNEPQAPAGRPEAPSFIVADSVALAEWERLVDQLDAMGTLSTVHRGLVAGYCLTLARLTAAQAVIAANGMTADTDSGPKKRPEVVIVEKCTEQIRSYAAELCITPGSQSRAVTRKSAEPENKKARFFKGA